METKPKQLNELKSHFLSAYDFYLLQCHDTRDESLLCSQCYPYIEIEIRWWLLYKMVVNLSKGLAILRWTTAHNIIGGQAFSSARFDVIVQDKINHLKETSKGEILAMLIHEQAKGKLLLITNN